MGMKLRLWEGAVSNGEVLRGVCDGVEDKVLERRLLRNREVCMLGGSPSWILKSPEIITAECGQPEQ